MSPAFRAMSGEGFFSAVWPFDCSLQGWAGLAVNSGGCFAVLMRNRALARCVGVKMPWSANAWSGVRYICIEQREIAAGCYAFREQPALAEKSGERRQAGFTDL